MNDSSTGSPRMIFVGDSGVGKSSLIHRAKFGTFDAHSIPTIGAGITQMNALIEGVKYDYQLWDTAGQEIYRNIVPIYFKGAACAILVFSLSDRSSFSSLPSWLSQLQTHAEPNTGIVIVGNKLDCEDPVVTQEESKKWATDHNLTIIFASAMTGENVDVLLEYIVSKYVKPDKNASVISPRTVQIDKSPKKECC